MDKEHIKDQFRQTVIAEISKELLIEVEDIDVNEDIMEYGVDSINVASIIGIFESRYSIKINPKLFFEVEDIAELIEVLWKKHNKAIMNSYQQFNSN